VKDENGDLLADSHNILNRWKNYFSQLLNVHNVNDVRQIEVHMAEPLAPGPSRLVVEIAIAKLKKYKSPHNSKCVDMFIDDASYVIMMESICDQDLSWLINFSFHLLFKAVEIKHDLIFAGGGVVEETNCQVSTENLKIALQMYLLVLYFILNYRRIVFLYVV
jgi:hypothetical protein